MQGGQDLGLMLVWQEIMFHDRQKGPLDWHAMIITHQTLGSALGSHGEPLT